MYSITVSFGPAGKDWVFLYHDAARANEMWDTINNGETAIILTDDFSQVARFTRSSIHAMQFEDMEKSKLAHIERYLHGMRTQGMAQQQAAADPAIRAAHAGMQRGPAIMNPMGGNGMLRG